MAKSILDRLKEGDFLTADYVRTYGLIESASFNRLFELEPRLSMSALIRGRALNYYYESARTT